MQKKLCASTCITIVAAFQLQLAAATPAAEDALVTPAVADLAERLGLDPVRDPTRFFADAARQLYPMSDMLPPALIENPGRRPTAGDKTLRVSVPLSAAIWSRSIFRHPVSADQLVAAILSDRRAALLCRGLSGLDDETLAYLEQHPGLLSVLYERGAGPFAAFGDRLRIRGQRVVPPGGAGAGPLWEAAVGAPLADPERFVAMLFSDFDGRVAYLYDVIASAEPLAARFAMGDWMPDDALRVQRFKALAAAVTRGYHEWRVTERPFTRPLGDLAVLLLRIRLEPSGAPAAPDNRLFWAEVFDAGVSLSGLPLETAADLRTRGPIDAAWLIDATSDGDMYARTDRLDQFSFGQRVFDLASDPPDPEAMEALKAFRDNHMLMLTLERLGIRTPSVYVGMVERADALLSGDDSRRFWMLAQFQGVLALLTRMQRVGTLPQSSIEPRVVSLSAVPLHSGQYGGGIARWIRAELGPVLPKGLTWEARMLSALSGPGGPADTPRLVWEGQPYRLDLVAAEHKRLELVREKQGGQTLDLALAIDDFAGIMRNPALTLDEVRTVARDLTSLAVQAAFQLRRPPVNLLPAGVEETRDGAEWLSALASEVTAIAKSSDLRRGARIGQSLQELADIALGNALVTLTYAADIGDPDGAPLLAGNVALRHDFGLGRRDRDSRSRLPWSQPRQTFQPGVPWHISGSLLGLDIALAPLNLRRLVLDRVADAPKVSSIEREAFAVGVSMMDPLRLKNADRDAIADAIAKGRERVYALAIGTESPAGVADVLGLDGWRRRAVEWSIRNQPAMVAAQFSLVELLTLGGGAKTADLDAWGTAGLQIDGCACTRFPRAGSWTILEGRPQLPMMAATMGDLSLAVAVMLRDLDLPAALARPILAVGMQEFIDELTAVNSGDWWSLSRQAQRIRRQRVEDYVSAAAVVNGPLVPEESGASRDNQ